MKEIVKGMPDGAEAIASNFNELSNKSTTRAIPVGVTYADIFKKMADYAGTWQMTTAQAQADVNSPVKAAHVLTVTPSLTANAGWIQVSTYTFNQRFATSVSGGVAMGWKEVATADNAGIIDWQPNMDVKKGQLVTFKTLGTISAGLLTNPIFISLIDQNTGTSFPAADSIEGVSGKWKLMNSDAFSLTMNAELGNGAKADYIRHGNLTTVRPTSSFNSQPHIGSDFGTILLAGSVDSSLRPDVDSMMAFQTTNGYSNYFMILFRPDGSVAVRQQYGSAGDMGSGTTLYFTMTYQSSTRSLKWSAGVPTV